MTSMVLSDDTLNSIFNRTLEPIRKEMRDAVFFCLISFLLAAVLAVAVLTLELDKDVRTLILGSIAPISLNGYGKIAKRRELREKINRNRNKWDMLQDKPYEQREEGLFQLL